MATQAPLTTKQPLRPAINGASKPAAPPQGGDLLAGLPLPTIPTSTPRRVTGFIYGFSGAGKTHMFRTLVEDPDLWPALYIVCDQGQASIQDLVDNQKIVAVAVTTYEEVLKLFTYLASGRHQYKTVIIDNLTELHRSIFMSIVKLRTQERNLPDYTVSRNDYGDARTRVLEVIASFTLRLNNVNVFMTAGAADIQDEATSSSTIEPNISGKLSYEAPGYFDFAGYLYVKTPTAMEQREATKSGQKAANVRILSVNQTTRIPHARNRGNKLGDELINPTISKLYRAYVPKKGQQPNVES